MKSETEELNQYLQCTEILDYNNDLIQSVVKKLKASDNKGVNAQFTADVERLVFPVRLELGESDDGIIYTQPSSCVVAALKNSNTLDELIDNLPDET